MPRHKVKISHDLGIEEATARFKVFFEKLRSRSDLKGSWNEHTFTYSVTVHGIPLNGTLQVEEDSFKQDVKLPLFVMPFTGYIDRLLKSELAKQITPDNETPTSTSAATDGSEKSGAKVDVPIVLFLHIPKTGGTTLIDYIDKQRRAEEDNAESIEGLMDAGVVFVNYGFIKEPDLSVPGYIQDILARADLRAVTGHFWFGLHEYVKRPWVYITVLRNPVSRIMSLYHSMKLEDKMSIEEFVLKPPFKEVDNDQVRRIVGINPEIGELTQAHLEAAKENLRQRFAVVGITERFDETLMLFNRKLGWTKEIISSPLNVNPHKPARDSLSPQTIEAIQERNQFDLELYQYGNELMDEAIAAEGSGFDVDLKQYLAKLSVVV